MMSLVPASKFSIPKNASSKSVTRDQDQQNTNLEGSMDSLILPHSTSMAEYQGYNHNQQVRPLSQLLLQNPKSNLNKASSSQNSGYGLSRQIKGAKQKNHHNTSVREQQQEHHMGSIGLGSINNSSHNIMFRGERQSPIAESVSEQSSKPYHSQNRSMISQSSNEKDLNRKQKIQDLLKKAKNLTSPNQALDQRGRDFGSSKERDADEVDSGTVLQKLNSPQNNDETLFGSQAYQVNSPEKFALPRDYDNEEQDFLVQGASNKTWLSAERSGNQRESIGAQNYSYRSIFFQSNNYQQSIHSPMIEEQGKPVDRRQQMRYQLNESSNQIYNQGLVNNDSFHNQLDISAISNKPFRPSSQMSDENQNIDERDSENIGKRTTIHSMLSVLSLFSGQVPSQQQLNRHGKMVNLQQDGRTANQHNAHAADQSNEQVDQNKNTIKVKMHNNKQLKINEGYNKVQNQQLLRELKAQVATSRPNESMEQLQSSSTTSQRLKSVNQLAIKKQQKSSQENLNNDRKTSLVVKQPVGMHVDQHQSFDQISQRSDSKQPYKVRSTLVQRYIPKKVDSQQYARQGDESRKSENEQMDGKVEEANQQSMMNIMSTKQNDIEVKLNKNKIKMNYIKKSAADRHSNSKKQLIDTALVKSSKTMTTSQSNLPTAQGINNLHQILNKKSIQINTNLEPGQSKKQYEKALAQAKKYVKQQSDTQSNKEADAITTQIAEKKTASQQQASKTTQQPKDKKQNISCGNITLLNVRNNAKGSVKDKNLAETANQEKNQQVRERQLVSNNMLVKHSDHASKQSVNKVSVGVANNQVKRADNGNDGQFSPGSIYIPNTFHQAAGYKNNNRQGTVCSEKSMDNKSCSVKSGTSSDTQINIIGKQREQEPIIDQADPQNSSSALSDAQPQNTVDEWVSQYHPKTITHMSLRTKVIKKVEIDEKNKQAKQMSNAPNQMQQKINVSAQKSNSGIYEHKPSNQVANQFVIPNNQSPFSNLKRQLAKTPQDNSVKSQSHLFNSNLSDSCDNQLNEQANQNQKAQAYKGSQKQVEREGKSVFDSNDQQNDSTANFKQSNNMPILSQMKRKQILTTTNQQQKQGKIGEYILGQKKEVITSKSGIVQHQMLQGHDQYANHPAAVQSKQQTKYFTFEQNGIFNPKNPVSPARGHLATEFVKQRLGKQRYDQILKILNESENPILLLDKNQCSQDTPQNIQDQHKQILQLINNDRNFLSILQYIVNCSSYFWSAHEQHSMKDSSQNQSYTGSKEEARSTSQISIAHTPNSGFTLNSNYCANDADRNHKLNMGGANSFSKKMSYDSSGIDNDSSVKHRINIDKQNSIGQYSSEVGGLGLIGLGSAKSGPDGQKMHFHRPQDSINSIGKGKKTDLQHKLFTPSTQYTNNLGKQSEENPLRIKQRRQTFQTSESNMSDNTQKMQQSSGMQVNQFVQMQNSQGPEQQNNKADDSIFSRGKMSQNNQARTPGQQQAPSLRQLFKHRDISIEKYKIQLPGNNKDKINQNQPALKDFRVKSSKSGQPFVEGDQTFASKDMHSPLLQNDLKSNLKGKNEQAKDGNSNTGAQMKSVFNF